MKKILMSTTVLVCAYTLSAQEVMITKTTPNPAYSYSEVPANISANFQSTYPGITVISWEPKDDWWCATYKGDNGRLMRVYYNTQPYYLIRGESFKASLPVLNTFVPDAVMKSAVDNYGNSLYSITMMKSRDNEDIYHVTLIKNGMSEVRLLNNEGVVYTDVDKKLRQ